MVRKDETIERFDSLLHLHLVELTTYQNLFTEDLLSILGHWTHFPP